MKNIFRLATLSAAVVVGLAACGGGGGGTYLTETTPSSDVASLPANLLTQPASPSCSALRSGRYNQIMLVADSLGIAEKIDKWVIDAAHDTVGDVAGTGTKPLVSTGESCHYTITGGTEFVVSQAGVMVMRFGRATTKYLGVIMPEQTFTLADMEGTWNTVGLDSDNPGTYYGVTNTATINSTGAITSQKRCANPTTWDVTTCVDATTGQGSLRVNSDGGFDALDPMGAALGRVFAYKAGNGDVMAVNVSSNGNFQLITKQRTKSLPDVGTAISHWNLLDDGSLTSPVVISANSITVASTDATTSSWVRKAKTQGGTDEHPETLFANNPRAGYTFRPAGSALAADGSTATFVEFTDLDLRGMGVSGLLFPSQKRFMFSVNKP